MEEKKLKRTKISLIVFIILFVIALVAIGYGYKLYTDKDNEYKEINNKYVNTKKELEQAKNDKTELEEKIKEQSSSNNTNQGPTANYITYAYHSHEKKYNIYAEGYMSKVIGYNNELYLMSLEGTSIWTSYNCANEITEGAKFKKDHYECKENTDENRAYVTKLNIKESDIHKVILMNDPSTSDAQYNAFFIYKSGKVTGFDALGVSDIKALKNEKVKDIKKYYCTKEREKGCGLAYDIELQDGTLKTIVNK